MAGRAHRQGRSYVSAPLLAAPDMQGPLQPGFTGVQALILHSSSTGPGWTLRVTQGRFIICAAMCQPHCVVDSIVRLATRAGHLATILQPTKPAPTTPLCQGRLLTQTPAPRGRLRSAWLCAGCIMSASAS